MPKNCIKCDYSESNGKTYTWCMMMGIHTDGLEQVPNNCPLIEIPTPHGRLIDGDIVADMLDSMMVHKTLNNAFDEVLNMPTILEAEE